MEEISPRFRDRNENLFFRFIIFSWPTSIWIFLVCERLKANVSDLKWHETFLSRKRSTKEEQNKLLKKNKERDNIAHRETRKRLNYHAFMKLNRLLIMHLL